MTDPSNPEHTEKEQTDKGIPANEPKEQIQARLGQQLCSARKRRKLTIREASAQLKISEVYLHALEGGDWHHLPEEVYALAFLRQYAALLGEDCHEDIEALKSSDYQLTRPYTMPDPPIAPSKIWAVAVGILFVLLFILFNTLKNSGDETPPPKILAANTSPTILADRIVTTTHPIPGVAVKGTTLPSLPHQLPAATISGSSQAASRANSATLPRITKGFPLAVTTKMAIQTRHYYRLMAIGSSVWLRVYDPSGSLLKEVLLHAGQSLSLKSDAPFLTITCGNAAALKIEVDHTLYAAAGTLGTKKEVLRDFRINAPNHDH